MRRLGKMAVFYSVPFQNFTTEYSVGMGQEYIPASLHFSVTDVSPKVENRENFSPFSWKVLMMDASLTGGGGVLDCLSVQGTWSPQEKLMPINMLTL